LIVRDGAAMTAAGIAAGTIGAILAARAIRSLLFGVSPWDPMIFAGVPLALATIAIAAAVVPARKAAALDPGESLRRG
jgi:hypothetical protein